MGNRKEAGMKPLVTSKLFVKHNKLVIYIDGTRHIPVPLDCIPVSYIIKEKYFYIDYYTIEHGKLETTYTKKELWLAVLEELNKNNI